jgi:flavin reductase (DIM6/NTAB) family NADH-FMN oxidoreductase RutF
MLRNQIKKFLTGLTIPQEYVCLNSKELQYPLSVFLSVDKGKLDVTASHLFLGYKPLILALPFKVNDQSYQVVKNLNQLSLDFENPEAIKPTRLAQLVLKRIGEKVFEKDGILFYEGTLGEHRFMYFIHQWTAQQREKFRKQNSNNVGLPGNLVEQVRIAYSVPRRISIVTVSDGNLMNMFPTDLHGPVGEKFYAGSLRLGGLANDQIEKSKRIVISEVEPSFYKHAYSFGKNHMRELQKESEFPLHSIRSRNFNFPLPVAVTSYRELKRIDSFDVGIHRVHLYEVIHQQTIQDNKPSLTHIHQYYAQWRLDHGLETNMLLR